MNSAKEITIFILSLLSLLLIYAGVFAGEYMWYIEGFFLLFAVILYSFLFTSMNKGLLLLVILVFFALRYVPILKFNQPLFSDPVSDFAVATEFEKLGAIKIIQDAPIYFVQIYSGWPLIHTLTIMIHHVTGISLYAIFTYFPPILDLVSLFFLYLLSNYLFRNSKIAAISVLLYATFSINMFWVGTQIIRQSMAFPLALAATYLYLRREKNRKILALSIFLFTVLPISHHLTALEMFYILSIIFLIELFSKYLKKLREIFSYKVSKFRGSRSIPSISTLFTSLMCLLVGLLTFLYWVIYPKNMILSLFVSRIFVVFSGILGLQRQGTLSLIVEKVKVDIDIFDILTIIRVLLLMTMTLYGFFLVYKEQNRHRFLLYGFLFATLPLLIITVFFEGAAEWRHYLFLLIPVFLLSSKSINLLNKKCLKKKLVFGICLLIIILPAPFKLFTTLDPSPSFIYNKNVQIDSSLEKSFFFTYRDETLMAAMPFIATYANYTLMADFRASLSLLFYFDVYKIYPFRYILENPTVTSPQHDLDTIVIDNRFYPYQIERLLYRNFTEALMHLGSIHNMTNHIYDNGGVNILKIP